MLDFIIVGQGIAGSLLAKELIDRGKSIIIFDPNVERTSSKRAAGIYNPITGRKMVKTWLADELFTSLEEGYHALEVELDDHFLHPASIYRPFTSIEEQNDWQGRSEVEEYRPYIKTIHAQGCGDPDIIDPFGGLVLEKSGYVDLPRLISAFKKYFVSMGVIRTEMFHYEKIQFEDEALVYGAFKSRRIVFCEGNGVAENPFFQELKMKPNKGELLDVAVRSKQNQILNRGVFMVPKNGFSQIGSTYNNREIDWSPSQLGKNDILERLKKIFRGQFEILRHSAGLRPATFDRRPYLGSSKFDARVCIFNGLGTKGVTLAPYFSNKMADFLIDDVPLPDEVRLYR